jgi:hypothetical protein
VLWERFDTSLAQAIGAGGKIVHPTNLVTKAGERQSVGKLKNLFCLFPQSIPDLNGELV